MSEKSTRQVPFAFRDAVELWARQNRGTHGSIGWNEALKCYVIDFDLKPDDPRMKAYRDGRVKHEPKESIPLHRQLTKVDPKTGRVTHAGPYVAINLEQLGVSGLLEMLDKANAWSGRGEFKTMREAVQAAEDHNERLRAEIMKAAKENARDFAKDSRRQVFDLPFVNVPANIGEQNG